MNGRKYYYPKECFSPNEKTTKNNMKEYEKKCDRWYEIALKIYPDYYKQDIRRRIESRQVINKIVGYSL